MGHYLSEMGGVIDGNPRDKGACPPAAVWAVLERLGHNRTAGRLTEEEKFGGKMGRLDVPQEDGSFVTVYFTHSVVYGLTIVSEEAARAVALRNRVEPVHQWEVPKAPRLRGYVTCDRCQEQCVEGEPHDCPGSVAAREDANAAHAEEIDTFDPHRASIPYPDGDRDEDDDTDPPY